MRVLLVPIRDGSDIVSERLKLSVRPPAERLNRYLQVAIKANRVHHMHRYKECLGTSPASFL